ncbi:MAG: rod shape-determining protein [Hydrogenophaga sp.]
MLSSLKPLLYVQISPTRVVIKNLKTGAVLTEPPELAISDTTPKKVLGVGSRAQAALASTPQAQLVKPFAHPRSLVSDFSSAELLLKALVKQMIGKSMLAISPRIVIHPLGSPDGGFTQVERRAFRELGLGAGGSEVEVWTGRELTNIEVTTQATPPDAGEWGG